MHAGMMDSSSCWAMKTRRIFLGCALAVLASTPGAAGHVVQHRVHQENREESRPAPPTPATAHVHQHHKERHGRREDKNKHGMEHPHKERRTSRKDYEELGCYQDKGGADRIFGWGTSSDSMSVEECQEHCIGFMYFGVQYGTECYCDSATGEVDYPFDIYGESTACTMPCAGNQEQTCGGGWAMNVYINYHQN